MIELHKTILPMLIGNADQNYKNKEQMNKNDKTKIKLMEDDFRQKLKLIQERNNLAGQKVNRLEQE